MRRPDRSFNHYGAAAVKGAVLVIFAKFFSLQRASGWGADFSPRGTSAWPAGAVTGDRQLCSRSASFSLQRALGPLS